MSVIVNKIAESGIITLNLEDYLPLPESIIHFDLKGFLFQEMILKEKDFRAKITTHDWSQYQDKYVAVFCSADAIIPSWAYMLITSALNPYSAFAYFGSSAELIKYLTLKNIESIDEDKFKDARIVIKGCGDQHIDESAFIAITQKLRPLVRSLMYGEPCSTVPVYKRKTS